MVIATLLATLVACGGSGDATPKPSSLALLPARGLQLVEGGLTRPMPSLVPVAGQLEARLSVVDLPGAYQRELAIDLLRDGYPVEDASVTAHNVMVLMDHDTFDATAVEQGDGRYVLSLPFTMAGEWQVELAIASPPESGRVVVALDVFD